MKKLFLSLGLLVSVICLFSCSGDKTEIFDDLAGQENSIILSLSNQNFNNCLNDISSLLNDKTTRVLSIDETEIRNLIEPLINEGKQLQDQLLSISDLTALESESISNYSEGQLAVLSIVAHAIINSQKVSTRAAQAITNPELHCIGEALVGGGSLTGALTWGTIAKIGTKTALRMAGSALTGMVGGVITAAMFANDYNICMNSVSR